MHAQNACHHDAVASSVLGPACISSVTLCKGKLARPRWVLCKYTASNGFVISDYQPIMRWNLVSRHAQ